MSKVDEFSEELQSLAYIAKGLSHPARIAIIHFLSNQNSCIPIDLSQELPLSRGTVKQHLDELKERGWVKTMLANDKAVICLDKDKIKSDMKLLKGQLELNFDQEICC